jgi:hypothetical protein
MRSIWENTGGRHQYTGGLEAPVELYRESVELAEVGQALAAYIEARDRMNGAHEEFIAVLGVQGANVTEARAVFDRAENEMMRARRRWWLALAWERQGCAIEQERALPCDATGRD